MANSHDVFFGDVTVKGKLRSDDLEAADFRLAALNVGDLTAARAEVEELTCTAARAANLAENAFDLAGDRFYFGKEVTDADAGTGRTVFVCCSGRVTAGAGEIYAYASPGLSVEGIAADNWQRVFVDGAAEWREGYLCAVKRAGGELTVSGYDGKITGDGSYTMTVALPCAFADTSYRVAVSPYVEHSPELTSYSVSAFPISESGFRVTVNALENTRVGYFQFIAEGRWK